MNCRLLFNEEPITINKVAANVLGLNEAIVVQQIHYWLNINKKANKNFYDGRTWTYNTYETWQKENFSFWSEKTVRRIFSNLFKKGILLKANYNIHKYDRTLWISLDYSKIEEILVDYENKNIELSTKGQNVQMSNCNKRTECPKAKGQNVQKQKDRMTPPIPETTQRIPKTSISTTEQVPVVDKKIETLNINKELIESSTHLVLDSNNKCNKVRTWKKERLIKAIEIFEEQGGVHFSLLERIYKSDKNFVVKKESSTKNDKEYKKTKFHNLTENFMDDYETEDDFESTVLKMQSEKWG